MIRTEEERNLGRGIPRPGDIDAVFGIHYGLEDLPIFYQGLGPRLPVNHVGKMSSEKQGRLAKDVSKKVSEVVLPLLIIVDVEAYLPNSKTHIIKIKTLL